MSMLNGNLTLHDITDVEAFCRSIIHEHLAVGVKTNGTLTGPSSLTPTDRDELLAYLISQTWELSNRYHGKDDGRGKLRFSGYAIGILHKRIVDWRRTNQGSTRYGPRPVLELTDDERIHVADLVDLTGPEVLDLVNTAELAPWHRATLERVVIPIVFHGESIQDYARRAGKTPGHVRREIGALRRELERKQVLAA